MINLKLFLKWLILNVNRIPQHLQNCAKMNHLQIFSIVGIIIMEVFSERGAKRVLEFIQLSKKLKLYMNNFCNCLKYFRNNFHWKIRNVFSITKISIKYLFKIRLLFWMILFSNFRTCLQWLLRTLKIML